MYMSIADTIVLILLGISALNLQRIKYSLRKVRLYVLRRRLEEPVLITCRLEIFC